MAGYVEVGDYVRKDGDLVQVQSIDQSNQTYFTADGGVLGFDEVGMADKLERTTAALSQAREALESCQEGYFRDNGFEVLRMDYDKEAVNMALATIRELDGSA